MSRDWETHVYFEHRSLTRPLLDRLFDRLHDTGLALGAPAGERYPSLDELDAIRHAGSDDALERALRTREPPVGAGYGVLPFLEAAPGHPAPAAFLTFTRPDVRTGLDGVILVADGAPIASGQASAAERAFDRLVVLAEELDAAYAWADWETATFLRAAPSRRDVRAGQLPRLMRFNVVGSALRAVVDGSILAAAPRRRELPGGGLAFERPDGAESLD